MMRKIISSIFLSLLFVLQFHAQEGEFKGDPDTAFEKARELAFNKKRKEAQTLLRHILTKYPTYHDVRSFLGSTYSWDGAYDLARKEFNFILERETGRKSTWIAAINNELWSDQPDQALNMAKKALEYFNNDQDLLYLKASAEENSGESKTALQTVLYMIELDPKNEKARNYEQSLRLKLSYSSIGVKASVDVYSEVFDPMQLHSINFSQRTKHVSIIGRYNFSRRFNENGGQFELDLYPKIAKGFYAYLNIGFADTFLFPDIRYGGELHKSLPGSLELSLGFRALKYSTTTTIYTGSLTWYTGNSFWSFRPYITPGDEGTSMSGTLNYRRYRKDADNYFSIAVGSGFSPEINRFAFGGNEDEIINLKSQKGNIGYYFTSKNDRNLYGMKAGITHQEISFDPGNYFWIYSFSLSWDLKL